MRSLANLWSVRYSWAVMSSRGLSGLVVVNTGMLGRAAPGPCTSWATSGSREVRPWGEEEVQDAHLAQVAPVLQVSSVSASFPHPGSQWVDAWCAGELFQCGAEHFSVINSGVVNVAGEGILPRCRRSPSVAFPHKCLHSSKACPCWSDKGKELSHPRQLCLGEPTPKDVGGTWFPDLALASCRPWNGGRSG